MPKTQFDTMRVGTERGDIEMRFYDTGSDLRGVVAVGDVGGGFDSPACELYSRLGEELPQKGVAVLRVRFREPRRLAEDIADTLLGVDVLERQGIEEIGILGHSLGGAAAIAAGVRCASVKTVVTLATQSFGAGEVGRLAPRSILLLHGTEDPILPPACSTQLFYMASHPKDLELFPGAGHTLDEVGDVVFERVRDWLLRPDWEAPAHPSPLA